jgi:hypothetical protein
MEKARTKTRAAANRAYDTVSLADGRAVGFVGRWLNLPAGENFEAVRSS